MAERNCWTRLGPICFLIVQLSVSTLAYEVQPGDTLSALAHHHRGRLYGSHGALAKILALNPQIRDPNYIQVGQEIRLLPSEPASSVNAPAEISSPRAPSSDAIQTPQNATPQPSELSVRPSLEFQQYQTTDASTGAKAVINSTLSQGLGVLWTQHFSAHWSSLFSAGVLHETFDPISNFSFDNSNQTLFQLGLGLRYQFTPNWTGEFLASEEQLLFFHSTALNTVSIDSVTIPVLTLGTGFVLWKTQFFSYGIRGSASAYMPAQTDLYNIDQAYGYAGGLFVTEKIKSSDLTGSVIYQSRTQNTSIQSEAESDIIFGLELTWPFGI